MKTIINSKFYINKRKDIKALLKQLRECLNMACHYHPERESTDVCAICGKPICKECGLEIAGKIYCKDCLQKIVGIGLENNTEPAEQPPVEEPVVEQPPVENIYDTQEEVVYASEEPITQEYQKISEDSPYNIKDNINYSGGLESSYLYENEKPQAVQNEAQYVAEEPVKAPQEEEFIYPDHSFEPEPTSARVDLEDKYEKYLDDLYFDENEVPLEEQLAKDEEQFGSLTRKPYKPSETPAQDQKLAESRPETPEEMEERIRAEIMKEQSIEPEIGKTVQKDKEIKKDGESIHNLNYQDEKEPMNVVDIILTIVLVVVILIVIYYLIYLFLLHSSYPTFMDAVFGLTNPQNVINNILSNH